MRRFTRLAFTHTSQSPAKRSLRKHALLRSLAVIGGLAAFALAGTPASAGTAHAAGGLSYRNGLYVENGWLCRGWPNGTYHCTQRWYRTRFGGVVSLNQAWVPTSGGFTQPRARWTPVSHGTYIRTTYFPRPSYSWTPAGISQWAYTGHPAYGMSDYRGDPNAGYFGSCTWYAQYRRMDESLIQLGNAWQWAYNARWHGLRTGSMPAVGATVVFQSGVQGASGIGHVGHVEAVYGNGWFLESAMSTYWNGGGWGRVSYVYAHTGYGVSFIY
jgi:surface antigen